MLKQDFITISQKYTQEHSQILVFWEEIEKAYKGRAYHHLGHIKTMYKLLSEIKERIEDWESLVYAMVYHDFVYDIFAKDNEKKSAVVAQKRLKILSLPYDKQKRVFELIMATKEHSGEMDSDCAFFVDVDLAILGMPRYEVYAEGIRKEYDAFSDSVYAEGRNSVIEHFIAQKQIYHSSYFFEKFETLARKNLEEELGNNLNLLAGFNPLNPNKV